MMKAARNDDIDVRKYNQACMDLAKRKPAINKLQTLKKIKGILTQKDMHDALLESDVLTAINGWLEVSMYLPRNACAKRYSSAAV
jgi:hypothetical protein